ncbi:MAG: cold-shock protein [Bdellovibrionales bacterium CG10_big_fil_rev_8_21_14_0_10_45_34]|nr:MAG: cold-shock protein [Bdellovibrionales bacterium CG10_big_fil_rev_8_21_14_0_10_45_34]
MPSATGRVKWFNETKGYGFIEQTDGQDVFFHYSAIKSDGYKAVPEGVAVQFEFIDTERGPQASNIQLIEDKKNLANE